MTTHKRQLIESAMERIRIALIGDQSKRQMGVNIDQARAVLDELERTLGDQATIYSLPLDAKTLYILDEAGIKTVDELRAMEVWQLLALQWIGGDRVRAIMAALEKDKN
jgi:DNA-directed RNA polymerase alpha subunit